MVGAVDQVGPGADDAVATGEVALDQVARGGEARRAAVQAAEQQLHEWPRHLGGDESLGRRVEGAHVQRPRVAEGGGRSARRERLMDVHEVELGALEQLLDRSRDVERDGH